jgi:glycosyltransferase involved in cell wall biosynthesis
VLPCHNEEASVERVVTEVTARLGAAAVRLEVIVVDDGSRDRTGVLADRIAAEDARVRVVHHPECLGYGAALRSGFAASTADWVFYTDGDGQFDVAELLAILPRLEGCDAVIGQRMQRAEGAIRNLFGWFWTRLVNAVFGFSHRDIDCAFKIFPGWFVRGTPFVSTGALISAELVARAEGQGLRIEQVGVRHRPRLGGTASGASPLVILRAFRELLALRSRIREGR